MEKFELDPKLRDEIRARVLGEGFMKIVQSVRRNGRSFRIVRCTEADRKTGCTDLRRRRPGSSSGSQKAYPDQRSFSGRRYCSRSNYSTGNYGQCNYV